MKITVVHGAKKHDICLEVAEEGEAKVSDLSDAVFQKTGVPMKHQKLIYKGKSLTSQNAALESLGIREGAKVMLIGRKESPEEELLKKSVEKVEQSIPTLEKKQREVRGQIEGIEKGYLQKELVSESLRKLTKSLAGCHEEAMRLLEKLDAIEISQEFQRVKDKRKNIITNVQSLLDQNDQLDIRVKKLTH